MKLPSPTRLPRRVLLSVPAIAAAAVAVVGLRPTRVKADAQPAECLADLIQES